MDEFLQELNAIQNASDLSREHRKTLALLRALKAGTVSLDNVTISGDTWNVAEVEPEPAPAEAATEPPDESE